MASADLLPRVCLTAEFPQSTRRSDQRQTHRKVGTQSQGSHRDRPATETVQQSCGGFGCTHGLSGSTHFFDARWSGDTRPPEDRTTGCGRTAPPPGGPNDPRSFVSTAARRARSRAARPPGLARDRRRGGRTRRQADRLQLMGCDFAQGYLFARPPEAGEHAAAGGRGTRRGDGTVARATPAAARTASEGRQRLRAAAGPRRAASPPP